MEACWEPSTGTDSTRYWCSSSNKKPSLSQGGLIAGGPHITSPAISEFRSHAFKAAVSKARELGWIV